MAQVRTIDTQTASGDILLNVSRDSLVRDLKIGEWVYIRSEIADLPEPKNPFQFDYGQYLQRRQIHNQLSIKARDLLKAQRSSSGLRVGAARFRESVQKSLRSKSFTKDQLAIIEALVLGQKQGIDKEMSSQYAAAGMMHILAVSGLHVGIVLLLLRFLLRPINWYHLRWGKSVIIILLIWGFAFITGLSPSVMRAATMFTFLEIGAGLGGKRKSRDAVLVSALLLLLYNPQLLYHVGFQLSYLAVLAILWIQPWLEGFWQPKFWILRYLWGIATVTVAAQIGVMPLSLFYFHQFPGLFFISNIIILPFLGIVLSGGILISGLSVIGWLPEWLVIVYGDIINLMNACIGWISSQERFVSNHISLSQTMLILSYLLLISFVGFLKKFTRVRLAIVSIALMAYTTLWIYEDERLVLPHLAILNKSKSTSIAYQGTNQLHVFTSDSLFNLETDYRVNSYRDALPIERVTVDSMQNYFSFKQKELLVIDRMGIYDLNQALPDYILLSQSPRINLDRLISKYPNAIIIADASNYRSYVDRWQATCLQRKIPFHSTYEKGAFIIE